MKPTQVVTRPALRYHGGKWRIAPTIISFFPPHRTYVEPFGGAASILLRKPRCYAEVYNDLDGEVVNVFRQARDDGTELRKLLYFTPFSREEFLKAYEPTEDLLERARRTIVRSFMGFGAGAVTGTYHTGFRSNCDRAGTTPAHDWKNYTDMFDFLVERLRGVTIENRDAYEVIEQQDGPNTLFYFDPPYVTTSRSQARHGYRHEMTDKDHVKLLNHIKTLKGCVVLSGYQNDIYDDILKMWTRHDKHAIDGGMKKRVECVWISPKTAAMLSDDWMTSRGGF